MTAPGVEGVLIEVAEDHDLHPSMNICTGCSWRPVADHGSLRRQHTAHVAAEQAKALAEWAQQDEVVLRGAEGAFRDHTGRDIHEADETAVARQGDPYLVALWSGWSRAVLTAIFGSPS